MEAPLLLSPTSAVTLRAGRGLLWRGLLGRGLLTVALLALAACGPTQVDVQGEFPAPLVEPLPVTIGVWYDEAFAGHEFSDLATGRGESGWVVRTGDAQVLMWDAVLAGMFEDLVHMKGEPAAGQMNQIVDGVLIPSIDELQYAIPAHTSIKVYEIWLRYRFKLVSTSGEPIAEWTMSSYGKTPTAFLQSDEAAVNLAAVMALRDAGAHFITTFTEVPALQGWLAQRGIADGDLL